MGHPLLDRAAAHQIRLVYTRADVDGLYRRELGVTCACRAATGRPPISSSTVESSWRIYDAPAFHVHNPVPFTGDRRYVPGVADR